MDSDFKPTFDQLVNDYRRQRNAYKAYADFLKAVLAKAAGTLMPYAVVEARAKQMASFAEKVVRKQGKYRNIPGYDLTDRCGARVVVQTLDELDLMCRFIKHRFDIDWANSVDKKTELKDDQFGYLGVHYIVRVKAGTKEMEGVPVPRAVKAGPDGFKAEVQVKTLLQHAWANPLHDRLYKVALKLRSPTKREAAGVMAAIEAADSRITRLAEQIDSFLGHYAAYLSPKDLVKEIEVAEAAVSCETDANKRAKLQLRLGRLLALKGDLAGAITRWEPAAKIACPVRDVLKVELGDALCRADRGKFGRRHARGQTLLKQVAEREDAPGEVVTTDQRQTRARAANRLARSMLRRDPGNRDAYAWYRRAHETLPDHPYYLSDYLAAEIQRNPKVHFARIMRQTLWRAIETCREHVAVGIEQPRAQFTMGRLHLLIDEPQRAIDAFLKGIAVVMDAESLAGDDVLADEIEFLERIHFGSDLPPEHDQVRRLLELAMAARRVRQGEPFDLSDEMTDAARAWSGEHLKRSLIVVGGAGLMPAAVGKSYAPLVRSALKHADGLVVSGGTTVGVPGLVGRAAGALKRNGEKHFTLVGYLPERAKVTIAPDRTNYDALVYTRGQQFGPLEPIQGWIDTLGCGIDPSAVRVLGIEGGEVAAVEYRLALALGATVAVIPGSGRAADALLADRDWAESPNLIVLPNQVAEDEATMRALVRPAALTIEPDALERIAQAVHEAYLTESRYSEIDPTRAKYPNLPDDLKASNRQQVLYAAEILASEGYQVRRARRQREIRLPDFKPPQIQRMAKLEHGRWNVERLSSGWKPGPKKDPRERVNPNIAPWGELDRRTQSWDKKAISQYARHLAAAGYEIVPNKGEAK